jgi:hypothetical protein
MRKPTKIVLVTVFLAAIACQLLVWNHIASSKRISHAEETERPLIYNNMYQPPDLLW